MAAPRTANYEVVAQTGAKTIRLFGLSAEMSSSAELSIISDIRVPRQGIVVSETTPASHMLWRNIPICVPKG